MQAREQEPRSRRLLYASTKTFVIPCKLFVALDANARVRCKPESENPGHVDFFMLQPRLPLCFANSWWYSQVKGVHSTIPLAPLLTLNSTVSVLDRKLVPRGGGRPVTLLTLPLTYSEHLTSQTLQASFFFEPKDFKCCRPALFDSYPGQISDIESIPAYIAIHL